LKHLSPNSNPSVKTKQDGEGVKSLPSTEEKNNKPMRNMFRKLIILLLPALLLSGCDLREDLSDCVTDFGNTRLRLSFTYDNHLADDVGDIRIFVFDRNTDLLAMIIEPSAEEIARGWVDVTNLPAGDYAISTWGSDGGDMAEGGFSDVQMDDASTHSYTSVARVGETSLDDFRMMIEHNPAPAGSYGDITPKETEFDDLFSAFEENFRYTGVGQQTLDFDFVRNSHILEVQIEGLQHLVPSTRTSTNTRATEPPLDVFAVGRNGRYRWNNTIDEYARLVHYVQQPGSFSATNMNLSVKMLRLDLTRHVDDPVLLYVKDPATGRRVVDALDIVEILSNVRDGSGNLVYGTQEQLDREYEFQMRIVVPENWDSGDLSVKIFIGDWEVETPNADIDRP
jgi:hypothetical protein